jgi:intein/homing endonuclease
MKSRFGEFYEDDSIFDEVRTAIVNLDVMPSMRALMSAGPALERDNIAGFNCSFIGVDHQRSFDEALYVLMNGTGVGFSVESQFISQLPTVAEEFFATETVIVVRDSKLGWAKAFRELIALLYSGQIPQWDVSQVRAAGERLKVFGGRSSGPAPLESLFEFTVNTFRNARGRKLKSIEAHDIMCKVGEVTVVGGVRRAALISFSDLDDFEMAKAKSGNWWEDNPQRALANNTAVYKDTPSVAQFLREWRNLYESKSGERGMTNEKAIKSHFEKFGRREFKGGIRSNPCHEIFLRSNQFCNLSEVVVRESDTKETLKEKVRIAAVVGTWQSALTNFKYIRKAWKHNTEEERLLGVSLTGVFGNSLTNHVSVENAAFLSELREVAVAANVVESKIIGISPSVSVTCNKPSGCRPKNAIVTSNEGIYTLEELVSGDSQWEEITGKTSINGDKISKSYKNGVSETLKVKLSYGVEIEATPNHQWKTIDNFRNKTKLTGKTSNDEWVKTSDLQPGMIIESNVGCYSNNENALLVKKNTQFYHNIEKHTMPEKMDADFAWLIGYIWGDGTMQSDKGRIRLIDQNLDSLEKAQRVVMEKFDKNVNIFSCGDRDAWRFEFGSRDIYDFFLANGIDKSLDGRKRTDLPEIPLVIRESSFETICAFIAGLVDSDGCVSVSDGEANVIVATSYKQFSKHLQDVAMAVGIVFGRSHNTKGENLQDEKSMWLMSISGASKTDRFSLVKKHSIKMSKCNSPFMCDNENRRKFFFGKVISVEEGDTVETFDVEVENSHWFYAGALKSHNTVSQLTNVSSGVHPWYSPYYVRTVRGDNKDPLTVMMKESGIPHEPDVMKPDDTTVFSFPIAAPEGAVVTKDLTAVQHLDLWKMYRDNWTEHNPSITINVHENEWVGVAAWVYDHFDDIGGVSFLPATDHVYRQAPYQEITKAEYDKRVSEMPSSIRWQDLSFFESDDNTTGSQELACAAGGCEIP